MNDMIDATRQPVVFVRDGEAFCNSRDIADAFEKNHRDVMRAIDILVGQEPTLALRNFAQGSYQLPSTGSQYHRCFDMNRDGFTLLAMGFTGGRALKWKLKYIEAFNAMEAELREKAANINVRDPSQLAAIAIQLIEVNKELEHRAKEAEEAVVAAMPKTKFYDQFANADGLYSLQNAASVLRQGPNKFVGWLKQGYLFYQGSALVPKVKYREAGYFEVKATIVDDKARYQTFITPKGIQYFSKKLGQEQLRLSGAA